ncbi:MAG TPA: menaquinone biosynthesis protein [Tepidisphaeraceae bacterium]|jgi:chorismate dehydratase
MSSNVPVKVVLRISSVGFFNATPLVYGLTDDPALRLRFAVPSELLSDLEQKRADVALLPVIDFQRLDGLRVIPVGGIACDGPTLTVRLFSKTPINQTTRLAADTDSHTSVVLARVLLDRLYGLRPQIVPLDQAADLPGETRLLIGDKVVCQEPQGFPHQLDLGQAWKEMTGHPFVFAVWMARDGVELGDLPQRLTRAREQGLQHVNELIERFAVPRGWPVETARLYLTSYLQFSITPRHIQAIELYHKLAYGTGTLNQPPTPLRFV